MSTNNKPVVYNVIVREDQISVGASPGPVTLLFVADPKRLYNISLHNSSPAGVNIRIGGAPSILAPAGQLLTPGSDWSMDDLQYSISAIADGAGALLDILLFSSPPMSF